MPWTVNGVQYPYRRALYANTSAIGAVSDTPLPFVGPNLSGLVRSDLFDAALTEADGATLLGNPGGGKYRGWWESKTLTAPVGHGQFDLAGGGAAELAAYLYYGNPAITTDPTNQSGTYPTSWKAFLALSEVASPNADATGNGHNGTWSGDGVSGTTGQIGGAIQLAGTDDWTDLAGLAGYSSSQAHSYIAWVKHSGSATILWVLNNGDTSQRSTGLALYKVSGTYYVSFWMRGGTVVAWGNTPIPANTWHHIAATYDGTEMASGVQLYVDGVLQSLSWYCHYRPGTSCPCADPCSFSIWIGGNSNPRIGASANGLWDFVGAIDHVSVHSASVTADQIKALYQSGKTSPWWTWGAPEAALAGGLPLILSRLGRVGPSLAGTRC